MYYDSVNENQIGLNMDEQPQEQRKFLYGAIPRSAEAQMADAQLSAVTECEPDVPEKPDKDGHHTTEAGSAEREEGSSAASSSPTPILEITKPSRTRTTPTPTAEPTSSSKAHTELKPGEENPKSKELHQLVQHLYIAQARVQLEATEIKKSQSMANAAQQELEEAANHVRSITAALQTAQQEVAASAIRAQTAQLQLAAHDQLLFAARQDVDALSSQMVGLQAAEGISQPSLKFDMTGLLERLKQPLAANEKPTPIPPVAPMPAGLKVKLPTCTKRDTFILQPDGTIITEEH